MDLASLPTAALDYVLPPERIATRPARPRDAARMLVLHAGDPGRAPEHRQVRDLPSYLRAGDLLVCNDTAVVPARFHGRRAETGGRIEGLFLAELGSSTWRVMLKPGRRCRPGQRVELLDAEGAPGRYTLELVERLGGGAWRVALEPAADAKAVLDAVGHAPLPPYVLKARADRGDRIEDEHDRQWYQTVYAEAAQRRSVAAPTAGLHFTAGLLDAVDRAGARRACVTLHVGAGTFKPISATTIDGHEMHREAYEIPRSTIDALTDHRDARRAAKDGEATPRVIAVGTTTVRALESLPALLPSTGPVVGETDLLIAPPYVFEHVDGMLTNFHLPRSTLLALVAAMTGLDRLLAAYREAIARGYRFYSYGDAMLIIP